MSKFTLCGRLVTHTGRPHFQMLFVPRPDGGWDGQTLPIPVPEGDVTSAAQMAKLAREAGDFFRSNYRLDWLQETVIARTSELGLTAYALATRTGQAVSEGHIRAYLTRRKSMGSHKLQHLLRALDLRIIADD